ncbi:MAG: hypothetical protein FJ265_12070 [Planctomycetes bacterium]|nr:hypothetical protein [Planctomycetota bacterium]
MIRNSILPLAATALLTAAAAAQNCTDNQYRLHLVDQHGVPAPTFLDPVTNETTYQFATEAVYLAFDPLLPSGTYYVHVTDPIGGADMVLSRNDPMDRFVAVTNTAGVITLSLPYTNNQTPAVFGLGLNGQGQSILLQPFGTNPAEPCRFKAWFGDDWDLSNGPENPYLLRGGFSTTLGRCAVRSYSPFRIGDGTGSDVAGELFRDDDRDGSRDPGEPGLAGWTVRLVTGSTSVTALTDGTGRYVFADVAAASYTVELTLQSGFVLTTAGQYAIEVCGCANVAVGDFGVAAEVLRCEGHTIGFWRNCRGLHLVQQHNILPTLPGLFLRNFCGHHVAPGSLWSLRCYLQGANSVNMAYMLSAQLLAMHNNVMVGFVDPNCRIRSTRLGNITVAELMQRAILSLMAHGFTPPWSPHRAEQTLLKNALDDANNNRNWL